MRASRAAALWACALCAACGQKAASVRHDSARAGTAVAPAAPAAVPCVVPSDPDAVPQLLADTGCFDAHGTAAATLIPYGVNVPLWVDGANKGRWIVLPPDAHISFGVSDPFDAQAIDPVLALPPLSAVFKSFTQGSTLLETRALVRHADGSWGAYTYAWNQAQDAATLVPDGTRASAVLNGQAWSYPSRQDCLTCHGTAAGTLLGMQRPQLDRVALPGSTASPPGTNQLQAWVAAGWLDATSAAQPDTPWPALDDPNAPLPTRARAYLAANCSFCHRLGGASNTATDYRFDTALSAMGICQVAPVHGDLGVAGAQLLTPGQPQMSVLSLRLHSLAEGISMPPIGHTIVDTIAAGVIDEWITGLVGCSGP